MEAAIDFMMFAAASQVRKISELSSHWCVTLSINGCKINTWLPILRSCGDTDSWTRLLTQYILLKSFHIPKYHDDKRLLVFSWDLSCTNWPWHQAHDLLTVRNYWLACFIRTKSSGVAFLCNDLTFQCENKD